MTDTAIASREDKESEEMPAVSKEDKASLLVLRTALKMLWQVHDDLQASGIENSHLEQSIEGLEDCIDSIRLQYVVADPANAIPFAQVKAELGLEP